MTGNSISVSLELARRFLLCRLDARTEHPERRPFKGGAEAFVEGMFADRAALLSAGLTIFRWGRQNASSLTRGKATGSYGQWEEFCRDPLMTLGLRDAVARQVDAKIADPTRMRATELSSTWFECHGAAMMRISQLSAKVTRVIDPQRAPAAPLIAGPTRCVAEPGCDPLGVIT